MTGFEARLDATILNEWPATLKLDLSRGVHSLNLRIARDSTLWSRLHFSQSFAGPFLVPNRLGGKPRTEGDEVSTPERRVPGGGD